jgi:hypothetical protein
MHTNTRYLLILACSQRKCARSDLVPAVDRYDGGSYRVLRKALRENNQPEGLDILILSAKYGLIEASTPIANYDQRMTAQRAKVLQEQVKQKLQSYVQNNNCQKVYIDVGRDYLPAIGDLRPLFLQASITYAHGQIGERLAQLKQWLTKTRRTDSVSHQSPHELPSP